MFMAYLSKQLNKEEFNWKLKVFNAHWKAEIESNVVRHVKKGYRSPSEMCGSLLPPNWVILSKASRLHSSLILWTQRLPLERWCIDFFFFFFLIINSLEMHSALTAVCLPHNSWTVFSLLLHRNYKRSHQWGRQKKKNILMFPKGQLKLKCGFDTCY